MCFGAGERMFRTGRVCLCVVVGRCGGEVLLGLNRFFIGVNEYDSYEMLTFASWKTKVC